MGSGDHEPESADLLAAQVSERSWALQVRSRETALAQVPGVLSNLAVVARNLATVCDDLAPLLAQDAAAAARFRQSTARLLEQAALELRDAAEAGNASSLEPHRAPRAGATHSPPAQTN